MNGHGSEGGRKLLTARRLTLLASVAGIGAAVLFAGPGTNGAVNLLGPSTAAAQAQTQVQTQAPSAHQVQPPAVQMPSFAPMVQRVKPAVVSVRVRMKDTADSTTGMNGDENGNENGNRSLPPDIQRFFRQFGFPQMPNQRQQHHFAMAQGSGFFISPDGYIVTNNHVVNDAKSVDVVTENGKTLKAKIVGTDPKTDLALLKVDASDHPFVKLSSSNPRVGDWVIAVGNPFGLGGTVTAGIVSANGRDIGEGPYDDFIQIDAPVNRGNSGGPAFDADGNVIGVTTAIYSPSGGSVGIGFAIPAETVSQVVNQLKENGHVTRGWIGVQIQPVTKDIADSLGMKSAEGALVAEPQPNGPAAQAGIKAGDVIVSVNGKDVKDARDLAKKVAAIPPGNETNLGILRNGEKQTVSLKIAHYPKNPQFASNNSGEHGKFSGETGALGLTLAPANSVDGAGEKGVVVTDVNPAGPAAEHGFRSGDVILDIAGKAVSNPNQVRDAVDQARKSGKHSVLMRIKSGDNTRFVALPVGNG